MTRGIGTEVVGGGKRRWGVGDLLLWVNKVGRHKKSILLCSGL